MSFVSLYLITICILTEVGLRSRNNGCIKPHYKLRIVRDFIVYKHSMDEIYTNNVKIKLYYS